MATYQGTSYLEIRRGLQRRLRITDTATGNFDILTAINDSINSAIHDVVRSSWFEWTVREYWFNTHPPTVASAVQRVSVQAGSDHITGSGSVFTAGMSGGIILIAGGRVPYELLTISPTQDTARLVVGFEGTTNQTAASFRILRESFVLEPRIRAIRKMVLETGTSRWPLTYVPPRNWDQAYPRVISEERPRYYTVMRYTSDGIPRIKVWPVPNDRFVIRYAAYSWLPKLVNDADEIEMPGPAHAVVEDLAYADLITTVIREDSLAVGMAQAKAKEGLHDLVRENFVSPDWDMVKGDAPYSEYGMPLALYPVEFGYPVAFPP